MLLQAKLIFLMPEATSHAFHAIGKKNITAKIGGDWLNF